MLEYRGEMINFFLLIICFGEIFQLLKECHNFDAHRWERATDTTTMIDNHTVNDTRPFYFKVYTPHSHEQTPPPHNTWLRLCVHFLVLHSVFYVHLDFTECERESEFVSRAKLQQLKQQNSFSLFIFFFLFTFICYLFLCKCNFLSPNKYVFRPEFTAMKILYQNFIDIYSMILYAVLEFWIIEIHFRTQRANKRKKWETYFYSFDEGKKNIKRAMW